MKQIKSYERLMMHLLTSISLIIPLFDQTLSYMANLPEKNKASK